jgi:hypothetical protein
VVERLLPSDVVVAERRQRRRHRATLVDRSTSPAEGVRRPAQTSRRVSRGYTLEVTVVHPDGSVIARGAEPLTVR